MAYAYFNKNPAGKSVGDCTIRAISKALGQSWEATYVGLALEGFYQGDLPNADTVWSTYLFNRGFRRYFIPDDGLGSYTVSKFANNNPKGTFVLSMPGQHVVCVKDGTYYDSWDSGNEMPLYYWSKEAR